MPQNRPLSHIGIIPDGNRRWAKNRGLLTFDGHKVCYDKMKDLSQWGIAKNIKVLSFYAFSEANWNRSQEEVNYLMKLLEETLKQDADEFKAQGVHLKIIGQKERLPAGLQKAIAQAEEKTKDNNKLLFLLAISYAGRTDIIQAIKKIINQGIPADQITEELINKNLWTKGCPEPEVIIRTSGDRRLSNFLLWQSAYSEIFFIEKHWPDFTQADFDKIIEDYYRLEHTTAGGK